MFREALKWMIAGWCAIIGGFIVLISSGTMAFNDQLFTAMMLVPVITSPVVGVLR